MRELTTAAFGLLFGAPTSQDPPATAELVVDVERGVEVEPDVQVEVRPALVTEGGSQVNEEVSKPMIKPAKKAPRPRAKKPKTATTISTHKDAGKPKLWGRPAKNTQIDDDAMTCTAASPPREGARHVDREVEEAVAAPFAQRTQKQKAGPQKRKRKGVDYTEGISPVKAVKTVSTSPATEKTQKTKRRRANTVDDQHVEPTNVPRKRSKKATAATRPRNAAQEDTAAPLDETLEIAAEPELPKRRRQRKPKETNEVDCTNDLPLEVHAEQEEVVPTEPAPLRKGAKGAKEQSRKASRARKNITVAVEAVVERDAPEEDDQPLQEQNLQIGSPRLPVAVEPEESLPAANDPSKSPPPVAQAPKPKRPRKALKLATKAVERCAEDMSEPKAKSVKAFAATDESMQTTHRALAAESVPKKSKTRRRKAKSVEDDVAVHHTINERLQPADKPTERQTVGDISGADDLPKDAATIAKAQKRSRRPVPAGHSSEGQKNEDITAADNPSENDTAVAKPQRNKSKRPVPTSLPQQATLEPTLLPSLKSHASGGRAALTERSSNPKLHRAMAAKTTRVNDEDPSGLGAILKRYGDPKIPSTLAMATDPRLKFRF